MKEVKVCELQGAALDWAVAQAVGVEVMIEGGIPVLTQEIMDSMGILYRDDWAPSESWSQGGPLIEKFGIKLERMRNGRSWFAGWDYASEGWNVSYEMFDGEQLDGPSLPLIAACRAIVAAKLGDVVSIPDELVEG